MQGNLNSDVLKMDLVLAVRFGYVFAISLIVFIFLTPPLADRFLSYGPRDNPIHKGVDPGNGKRKARSNPVAQYLPVGMRSILTTLCSKVFNPLTPALDKLAAIRVPHAWFRHFYLLSIICTLFWGYQIYTCGNAYVWVLGHIKGHSAKLNKSGSETSDGIEGLLVCWILLLVQDVRRFVETIVFVKKGAVSKSSMWIVHWILGLLFYLSVNVAFWIERTDVIENWRTKSHGAISSSWLSKDSGPYPPYWIIALLTAIFLFYSYEQNRIHAYLSTLPSRPYELPKEGWFDNSIAPHYKAEVVIYSMLFGLASPPAPKLNVSMGLAWLFVLTNLWVTGWRTKEWYRVGFGDESVQHKNVL